MSSGSRVRREGTIAMSSKPYARRAFLPRPISISIAESSQSVADEKTPRAAGPKWRRRGAVEPGVCGRQPTGSEHSNGASRRDALGYPRSDMSDGGEHAATTRTRSRPAARPPGASATPRARRRCSTTGRTSTSSRRRRSPRATCTSATCAATRSATPTRASGARAGRTCCSLSASTPSACPPSSARSPAASRRASGCARCAEHMTGQLQRLGFSFDWERTFMSSDPVMYRWSQWLFLTLLEAGLVYRGTGNVDWCDTCQTTLATIQVEDGLCWRCHNPVRLIERPHLVPAHQRLHAGERPAPGRARRRRALGRGRAGQPALRARPRRRRRGRPERGADGEER